MALQNCVSDNYKHAYCLNTICNTVIPPKPIIVKADSGATRHYFTLRDKTALSNIKQIKNGPQVNLPNGVQVQATETGNKKQQKQQQ